MWLPIDTDAFVFLPFYAFNKKLKKKVEKMKKGRENVKKI